MRIGVMVGIFIGAVFTICGFVSASLLLDYHLCKDETPAGVASQG